MKYPQLVSTRAVNAISDWLVSRLEQLGVEAPHIYTRLLLSLLQSSVHINDPIEFSSLETFIVNRKGGGSIRRNLQFDANTLKKLNAIQCLSEIVSPEQELTSIEKLVEELWEKLKDIEKQIERNDGIEDTNIIDAPLNKSKADITVEEATACSPKRAAIFSKTLGNEKGPTIVVSNDIIAKSETETDPKKRYFNAFPALSKEVEDSFCIWRQSAKSLTWPANRCNSSLTVNQSSAAIMASAIETVVASDAKKAIIAETFENDELIEAKNMAGSHLNSRHHHAIATSTNGLKRKTKRRKSQSMSKGRNVVNMRKGNSNNENLGLASANQVGRKPNRHLSPTHWDTDFDGYWEMGRDLIKEFFAKQGDYNRNRCNSEGSVNKRHSTEVLQNLKAFEFNELAMNCNKTEATSTTIGVLDGCNAQTPLLMPQVDISFCYDENADDDDTYTSITELTADSSLKNTRSSPRRLYQRLIIPESVGTDQIDDNIVTDQTEIALFKAKFNRNIAAIWNDVSDEEGANPNQNVEEISTFNNHPLDFAKILLQQQQQNEEPNSYQPNNIANTNDCASLPFDTVTVSVKDDNFNFISMPGNIEGFINSSNGSNNKRRHDEGHTPVGVFLQDSIWSENLNGGKNTDTDESFYLKVWNSNKKLYNLDAVYEAKLNEASDDSKIDSSSSSASFQYYGGNSKWSEGINAGPVMLQQHFQQLQQHQQKNRSKEKKNCNVVFNDQNVNSYDCVDASMPTTASSSSCSFMPSTSGVFSGQTPSSHSSQQSWYTADSKVSEEQSITDMDGLNGPSPNNESPYEEVSDISLTNHSKESSGFVNYARIKAVAKSLGQDNIKQQQLNYQAQFQSKKDQPGNSGDENLLTSELTHFQPIKEYADGFTFNICSDLDVINYRRSKSGYLYYESQKYLEYTRNDNYMPEDEATTSVSAAPLYAGSNCEAAVAHNQQKEPKNEELVLKFRVMNHDVACQTDDEEEVLRSMYATQMHPLYLIFSGASTDGIKIPTTGQACSDAIEALNIAVAAAATAAAERDRMQLDRSWLGLREVVGSNRNVSQSHIWTKVQQPPHEEIGGDEIDFCNESSCSFADNASEQHWLLKTCQITAGDTCLTTACDWGTTVCSGDYKEAPPANSLLRDELNLEADQIMSDLKNMQDLYIGTEDVENESGLQVQTGDINEGVIRHPMAVVANKSQISNIIEDRENGALAWNIVGYGLDLELRQRETQQKVLQQVNKLIANLMRPEIANDTNVLADTAASAHRELGESLWPDDGEHSIWKNRNELLNDGCNSMQEIQQNTEVRNSVLRAEDKQFLSQLTWEHDNLAELWTKQTPPLTPTLPQQQSPSSSVCSAKISVAEHSQTTKVEQNSSANQAREISKCIAISATEMDSPSAAAANYKRIQQFLNSTSNNDSFGKLKLTNRKRRHSASQNYAILESGLGATLYTASTLSNFKAVNINHNNNNNYNNNNKISDLNTFNMKRSPNSSMPNNDAAASDAKFELLNTSNTSTSIFSDDVDMEQEGFFDPSTSLIINNNQNIDGDGVGVGTSGGAGIGEILPSKKTILTCKYWATIDPIMDSTEDTIDFNEDGVANGAAIATLSYLMDKKDSILNHVSMIARPLTR